MDLSKAALVIGVVALLLAVPLAIVANVLTPRLIDWWGSTTRTRTQKRIHKLEIKLYAAQGAWRFTPAEWSIRYSVYRAMSVVILGLHAIFSFLLMALLLYHNSLGLIAPVSKPTATKFWLLFAVVCTGYIGNATLWFLENRRFYRTRARHSAVGIDELQCELNKLKALDIISARYGTGNQWLDVTDRLKAKIENGKVDISVVNDEFGADPAEGIRKALEVKYTHYGKRFSKTVLERQRLSIPEP